MHRPLFFLEANMFPWVLLSCQEIPGIGQVHDYILQDAVTECNYHLEKGMEPFVLLAHYQEQLIKLQSTWRGVEASNMLARLRSGASHNTLVTPSLPQSAGGASDNTLVTPTPPQLERSA